VPILMYHNINPTTAGGNWVTVVNFIQQMDYLNNNGFTTISGDDFYNYTYKGTPLPTKPIWLTFDDSYQNIYDYALPIMEARNQKGSIFAVTQYMGQYNVWDLCCEVQHLHMTWNMMAAFKAAGWALDSHTQHHVRLQEQTIPTQKTEIWGTQRDMSSFMNTVSTTFCYPYGQFTDASKWLIAHSGFRNATTAGPFGKQYTTNADMFELSRIGIADSDSLTTFINKITAP
jgi:peptidoglycan/xylan/chitin deacetylase (PgdA/CDA1 family)